MAAMGHRRQLLALLTCLLACCAALAQPARLRTGDLVEFERPQGRITGIVIHGPDPSSYYLLEIAGENNFAIHADELRVIQPAGTPDAAMRVGTAVSWTQAGVPRKGSVAKVHGSWCQVEPPDDAPIAWVECESLQPVN
jgi:hypothetical protein